MKRLTIDRCPVHRDFWAVCIGDDDGGVRMTRSKCCGQWKQVKAFRMTADDWRELAEEALAAAEEDECEAASAPGEREGR
jgi:hypothetical protein